MNYLGFLRSWSADFTSPFAEALKEAWRITLFSIPAELIVVIQSGKLDYNLLLVNLSIIFLRAVDKFVHEKSKEHGHSGRMESRGISPI